MVFIQNPPGKIKQAPEFRILAYPQSAIGKVDGGGFGLVDVIRQLVKRDGGDSVRQAYVPPEGENIIWDFGTDTVTNNPFIYQNQFDKIDDTLEYIEINAAMKSGTGAVKSVPDKSDPAICGFVLKPIQNPYNSVINGDNSSAGSLQGFFGNTPVGNKDFPKLEWIPQSPKSSQTGPTWETVLPYSNPFMTCIKCSQNVPNATASVKTSIKLKRDQGMWFKIIWDGIAEGHTQGAGYRISFSDDTQSILWSYGLVPSYQQKIGGKWVPIRQLEGAAKSTFEGINNVQIRSILGRMVITIDDRSWAVTSKREVVGSGNANLIRNSWAKGKLKINQFGAQAVLGFGTLTYNEKGSFGRTNAHNIPSNIFISPEDFKSTTTGDKPPNTSIEIDIDTYPTSIAYKCTLWSNSKIYTPFVSAVMIRRKSKGLSAEDEPIDVSNCFLHGTETSGEPGVMPGADWSLTFDARLLDMDFPDGAWMDYLQTFNPISFELRWLYTDGTYSDWVGRLHGYCYPLDASADAPNKGEVHIAVGDPIIRFTAPNAIVDHQYMPFDYLFAINDGAPLYGADCIHEIIRIVLGQSVADSMNGGTIGEQKLRYFDPDHYPLYDATNDTVGYLQATNPKGSATSNNGPLMPAPFGDAPLNWMNQIAGYDFAALYWGFPAEVGEDGTVAFGSDWPVPIYGWYWAIVANRPTWQVHDAIYDHEEEFNQAVLSGSMGDMPEWMINRVLVWGGNKQADNVIFPSAFMAEARLNSDDPGSLEKTWPRTLLENNPIFMQVSGALVSRVLMTLAHLELRLFAQKRIRRVHLKFIGEERMGWGDKIIPNMRKNGDGDYSPSHLDLDGETFRIVKVVNEYDTTKAGTEQFMTTVSCAPFNEEYEE